LQVTIVLGVLAVLGFAINGIYQVARKPTELFFPVSGTLNKTPGETWRDYEPLFRKYSTSLIGPELLAALAQVEGSGNPVVRTYWRWSWNAHFFELYRPASSAVGMYQLTNGTFALARHYCIRDHAVIEDGPWNDWHSCWFNALYTRVIPSHAVELTAAYLDRSMAAAIAHNPQRHATQAQLQRLAAVIHLCGAGAGEAFVHRDFHLMAAERCGDHEVHVYLERVDAMRRVFESLMLGR
jgi:hypothetical protein